MRSKKVIKKAYNHIFEKIWGRCPKCPSYTACEPIIAKLILAWVLGIIDNVCIDTSDGKFVIYSNGDIEHKGEDC